MIKRICALLLCVLPFCPSLIPSAQAGTIIVGGTGSSAPIIKLLFDEFRKSAPSSNLNVINPPLGTGGAIRALAQGRIDLAVVGREVQPEEKSAVGLSFALASTPLVMASKDGLRDHGFTLDDLAKIYAGQLIQWDNGQPIRLLLRSSVDSDTLTLRAMSAAMDKAVLEASQRPGMVIADNDLETVDLISRIPGSLGPTSLGLLASMGIDTKKFALEGKTPSVAALKTGRYPWHKTLTVILPPHPSAEATHFADFLHSSKARRILLHYDYLPSAP